MHFRYTEVEACKLNIHFLLTKLCAITSSANLVDIMVSEAQFCVTQAMERGFTVCVMRLVLYLFQDF